MTEAELREKIAALGDIDEDTRNGVVCAFIGHSRIQISSFGYFYCARCDELLGDTLGGFYPDSRDAVIVGVDNERVRKNYENCTWKDKIYCPDPFAKESTDDDTK